MNSGASGFIGFVCLCSGHQAGWVIVDFIDMGSGREGKKAGCVR